jgi:mono/diheme cytochrome c family protein
VKLRSILLPVTAAVVFAVAPRSVWEGVYNKDQAARGLKAYREECLKCHGETLLGGEGGPAISGEEFLSRWNGKSAGDLYALLRKTMPSDDPGNLSTRQYADLLAYIFSMNSFPAGEKELDRDTGVLAEIRIEPKK